MFLGGNGPKEPRTGSWISGGIYSEPPSWWRAQIDEGTLQTQIANL